MLTVWHRRNGMACIVLVVIILMSLILGAELGPKADPTTTTYTPRPEWYFFFLFELLRVVKPPFLVFVATVGIPTILVGRARHFKKCGHEVVFSFSTGHEGTKARRQGCSGRSFSQRPSA